MKILVAYTVEEKWKLIGTVIFISWTKSENKQLEMFTCISWKKYILASIDHLLLLLLLSYLLLT